MLIYFSVLFLTIGSNLITAANFCLNGKFAVVGTYDGRCIFYETEVRLVLLHLSMKIVLNDITCRWIPASAVNYIAIIKYLFLLKTSYGILRILNFDWLTDSGIWTHIPLTTNMLGVRVFFTMIVANLEVFLRVFFIKQLFHSPLLDIILWDSYSQLGATHLVGYLPSHIQCARGIIFN